MNDVLKSHLASFYHSTVTGNGKAENVKSAFRKAMQEDSNLRTIASNYLAELKNTRNRITDRCMVSKIHSNFLEEVLNG